MKAFIIAITWDFLHTFVDKFIELVNHLTAVLVCYCIIMIIVNGIMNACMCGLPNTIVYGVAFH